jgi:peptidyl-prolyl cis-trans isomerase C
MTSKRRLIVGLLLLLAVAGIAVVITHRLHALPENAVLRYGDTVVTTRDFDRRVGVLSAVYGVRPPTDGAGRARFNRNAAKSYAVSLVLEEAAAKRGIRVADAAASREVSSLVDEKLGGDSDAFVDFLAQAGLKRSDVVDEVRRTMAARRLYAQVTATVTEATTADARRAYASHRASMRAPEQRTVRTIVVPSRADAERIRDRLDSGADFATVAREESRDTVSRADGGLLGTVARSALEPAFGAAAFLATEGAVFGPVQGRYGWNVGRVDAVIAARPITFDEIKDVLIRQLTAARLAAVWDPWLHQRLRDADIVYAPAYRPTDPLAAGADPHVPVPETP